MLLLTVINGVLSMSELAVVSSRSVRLKDQASRGNRGARAALKLIEEPSRFLSSVQIGITLVGILAGTVSGATLAARLGIWLNQYKVIEGHGDTAAMIIVVSGITYVTLVLGELVPKRIAMANAERIAVVVSRPMQIVARVAAPAVWLLKGSTDFILRLVGLAHERQSAITEDEVKTLIAEGTREGIFVPREKEMIEGVLRLADRSVMAIMTPRVDVAWIDVDAGPEGILRAIEEHRHSRLLVCEGVVDKPVGFLQTKDLLPLALRGQHFDLREVMTSPLVVPDRTPVLALLERFQREGVHIGVVIDEYSSLEGVVSVTDVLEAIAGDLPERGEEGSAMLVKRDDGSWLVDGTMPVDEFEDRTNIRKLRGKGDFHTIAGFAIYELGHLPSPGEHFTFARHRFEVIDMDGLRVDKLLVMPLMPDEPDID
ncbi:hemolysin family protein [Emcibacter sp. SYSU 3D8]|uniref:hemolysin family protein n=1 Tax=Emcibacter sp. SYSU 3D8 TaxID=3133969 RepID=UPI0031FEA9D2